MGNCQAAEAATMLIQHPTENKVERLYTSMTARQVMNSNPDHFVALLLNTAATTPNGARVKHLKLLRPEDTLVLGEIYRLVCVQDILNEFASKKCVKLAKLLEKGGIEIAKNKLHSSLTLNTSQKPENCSLVKEEKPHAHRQGTSSSSNSSKGLGNNKISGVHWKPALQSISELGS